MARFGLTMNITFHLGLAKLDKLIKLELSLSLFVCLKLVVFSLNEKQKTDDI